MGRRLLGTGLAALFLACAFNVFAAAAQSPGQRDPTVYLLPVEDLPSGFEYQPDRDRTLVEADAVRAIRLYTRGNPEVPTDEHASILLAASVSDSVELAAADFQETIHTWTNLGYELSPVQNEVGDEAAAGWDTLFVGTEHPKQAALLLFRRGAVNAVVQWTDDPAEVTLDHAFVIGRQMELRIDANASARPVASTTMKDTSV